MPDLTTVCFSAFIAVFVLLTILAIAMKAIETLFPAPEEDESTAAIIAAISTSYAKIYPYAKITKIKELQ